MDYILFIFLPLLTEVKVMQILKRTGAVRISISHSECPYWANSCLECVSFFLLSFSDNTDNFLVHAIEMCYIKMKLHCPFSILLILFSCFSFLFSFSVESSIVLNLETV